MEEIPADIPENKSEAVFLTRLRSAFDHQNLEELRSSINYIKERVERGGFHCSPMSDLELQKLLETGKGMISVGTGTSGQRIFIEAGEMYMSSASTEDNELGLKYHLNFKAMCALPFNEKEMRVRF